MFFITFIEAYWNWLIVYPITQKRAVKAIHLHFERWLRDKLVNAFEQLEVIEREYSFRTNSWIISVLEELGMGSQLHTLLIKTMELSI